MAFISSTPFVARSASQPATSPQTRVMPTMAASKPSRRELLRTAAAALVAVGASSAFALDLPDLSKAAPSGESKGDVFSRPADEQPAPENPERLNLKYEVDDEKRGGAKVKGEFETEGK